MADADVSDLDTVTKEKARRFGNDEHLSILGIVF